MKNILLTTILLLASSVNAQTSIEGTWKSDITKGAELTFTNNKFNLYIGCNRISGTYKQKENLIIFENTMSTKIFCTAIYQEENSLLKNGLLLIQNRLQGENIMFRK